MSVCRECGQGAMVRDAVGPICPDCIEEGYAVNEIYAAPPQPIADLPPTREQIMADERVQALVVIIERAKHNVPEFYTLWHIAADEALAALTESP